MSKRIDITNKRFGFLVALEYYGPTDSGSKWKCICDCGNYAYITSQDLRRNHTTSCGCMWRILTAQKLMKDFSNKKFGKLTALKRSIKDKRGDWMWECKCDCGNIKNIRQSSLVTGNSKTCGACK
jgi:hypothetical protein